MNERHELFCQEYIVDMNATRAYETVYNAKKNVAGANGSRLLENAEITKRIKKLTQDRLDRLRITQDRTLAEIARLAFVDISKIFNEDGSLKPIKNWPKDARRAVSSIEVEELYDHEDKRKISIGQVKKVKFVDKKGSLELLGKNLKLFTEKVEHSGKITLEDLVAASRKKEEKE